MSSLDFSVLWQSPKSEVADKYDVQVYSEGLCFMSVCAPKDMTANEVSEIINSTRPSGTTRGWCIADEDFASGQSNGCPCNDFPNERRHWLLDC